MMVGMARSRIAYNASDSPVVITAEGHTLGGREHGTVDPSAAEVVAAVDLGVLLLGHDADREPPALELTETPEQVAVAAELVPDAEPAPRRPRTTRKD